MNTAICQIQCEDAPGIVAAVSSAVYRFGGNINRSDQYTTDPKAGQFFMRLDFSYEDDQVLNGIEEALEVIVKKFSGSVKVFSASHKTRIAILVSKEDHCLLDLLYHADCQDFPAELVCVISNHETCRSHAKRANLPFHYVTVEQESKAESEQAILALMKEVDCLVLARYMQILSADFLNTFAKPIINIHHSFLPSFVGASPYQQAYNRGVKLIGATAHYVTQELDEGPIISQCVAQVTHRDSVSDLKRQGRNLEKQALYEAVRAHVEHRVMRVGNKTVVFG